MEYQFLQALHMNGGEGDTSYAKNSVVQRKILSFASLSIEEAIGDILSSSSEMGIPASLGIVDLGCSSGPNTLTLISEVIDTVSSGSSKMGIPVPELRVYLNDLPGNDFNDIFVSLPAFYQKHRASKGRGFSDNCFVSCVGGSFYGRLFPKRSLHFVHSSSSLHWLSQVPPALDANTVAGKIPVNKGKIYISKSSPESVGKAYLHQFHRDFSLFLKSRSEEVVPGGRMVLSFLGRTTSDPTTEDSCYQWELLAQALNALASKGRIPKEKIDSFNAPYYAPSVEEVRNEIEKEGSFWINSLRAYEVNWDAGCGRNGDRADEDDKKYEAVTPPTIGRRVAKTIRAVVESMMESQFGRETMDDLFLTFAELVDDYSLRVLEPIYVNLVISVTRKFD